MASVALSGRRAAGAVVVIDDVDADLAGLRWHADSDGYASRTVSNGRVRIYLHREIARRALGVPELPPGVQIDHVNRDRCDARRANLRVATHAENIRNRPKPKRGHLSRYKGVTFTKRSRIRPWSARINDAGRLRVIGSFATEIEAARAYDREAVRLHGAFACTNVTTGLLPGEASA